MSEATAFLLSLLSPSNSSAQRLGDLLVGETVRSERNSSLVHRRRAAAVRIGAPPASFEEVPIQLVEIDGGELLERDTADVGDHMQSDLLIVRMPGALLERRRETRRQPLVEEEVADADPLRLHVGAGRLRCHRCDASFLGLTLSLETALAVLPTAAVSVGHVEVVRVRRTALLDVRLAVAALGRLGCISHPCPPREGLAAPQPPSLRSSNSGPDW